MSSTALKTLAVVMVIAAIILGFVAWRMSQGLTQAPSQAEQQAPKPGEDQVLAVVATQRLPAYEPITEEQVSLVPISVEPPQYFTDAGEVVGRTPLQPVAVGFPITQEAFGAANTLAQAIPAGTQAMSLEISDVIAVGGFVKPGDMVDVLVYFRQQGDEVSDSQARVLLKNTRVLAYEERLINVSQDDDDDDGRQQRRQRTAVLAVPVEETTRVMLGASLGELRLSLRGEESAPSTKTAASEGEKPRAETDKPEALASSAAHNSSDKGSANNDNEKDDNNKERVITLKELAEIEKKIDKEEKRQRPPIVPIDIYEGTEKKRVYRAYAR